MQITQTKTSTTTEPLISFIITSYNLPISMLRECLNSILALSLNKSEREIVFIDDGSATSPLNELSSYADDIIYIRQSNSGLSEARNRGIQYSSGTYLQFVDGDDKLNPTAYDYCLSLLRSHDPDIVTFHLTENLHSQKTPICNGPMTGSEYMRHHNLRASACGYIFRRTLLLGQRFTPGILHEDEEFTPLLFLRADRLFSTDAQAYYYRPRGSSIMHKKDEQWVTKRLDDTLGVLFRLNERSATLPQAEREALQRRVHQLTMDYLYNVITLTHSKTLLEEALDKLHSQGLFPLPAKNYTMKYALFRRMVNSRNGRRLLLLGSKAER